MATINEIAHTENGTYTLEELLPEEARNLTLEQVMALLVYYISDHPEEIETVVVNSSRVKLVEFDVHPGDRGPILGRSGYTIHAMRTLAKAILGPAGKRFTYRVDLTEDAVSRERG